ncbi:MAG: ribonuclease P protein component [Parachlamydiaceae bacterium]|nr:ribonuclease P protein component [Parachlamydiaceae bacterium]
MIFSFPKAVRLRSRRDYKRMAKHFSRHEGNFLIIDEKISRLPEIRLGITVTKRFGDAHHRNRLKRIVREAFRLCYADLRKGIDINVRPLVKARLATVLEIQSELKKFFGS